MITVKCPYENCDWETTNTPYGGYYPTDDILITRYMLHCQDKHGLKNAIWERGIRECPNCGNTDEITVLAVLIDNGRVQKYHCGHCNYTWKVER